ncbi:MAG: ComEC/Rec2 family competence protein [bacterium]
MQGLLERAEYINRSISKYPLILITLQAATLIIACVTKEVFLISVVIFLWIIVTFQSFSFVKIFSLFCSFSLLWFSLKNQPQFHSALGGCYEKTWEITGQIQNYPESKMAFQQFILKPQSVVMTKTNETCHFGKALFLVKASLVENLSKGDTINFTSMIKAPGKTDDFDYQAYLETFNIYGLSTVYNGITIESHSRNILEGLSTKVRAYCIGLIQKNFPEPHAGLLAGMILGSREEFSPDFTLALQKTGTSHIVAVSGFNVTILITAVISSLKGKMPRKLVLCIALLLVTFFLLLVGLDNLPALRASIMGITTVIGILIGRKSAAISLLSLSFLIMLVNNPLIYRSVSLQLSIAATLGLIFLDPLFQDYLKQYPNLQTKIPEELITTIAAIIATFPVTFFIFGSFSFVAPITNLLLAGLIAPIMLLGFCFLAVTWLSILLSKFLVIISWGFLELMVRIIEICASWDWSYIKIGTDLKNYQLLVIIFIIIIVFEIYYRRNYAQILQ